MHIALAQKAKLIALFGPSAPETCQRNENNVILYNKVPCSPCVHKQLRPPCRGHNICMHAISIKDVAQEVHAALLK